MAIQTPFRREPSPIFRSVYRPVATVSFWVKTLRQWTNILMIVDSGADYTILPKSYAKKLGIRLSTETTPVSTSGVGGTARVFILRSLHKVKIGSWELTIPLGFFWSNDIPPLMGRQGCLETFSVCFRNHVTEIDKL